MNCSRKNHHQLTQLPDQPYLPSNANSNINNFAKKILIRLQNHAFIATNQSVTGLSSSMGRKVCQLLAAFAKSIAKNVERLLKTTQSQSKNICE